MKLKRLLAVLITCVVSLSSSNAYAVDYPFWIDEIGPEKGSIGSVADEKLNADVEKVRSIAMKYADRYIVTQEEYVDTSCIDNILSEMSTPISFSEWDSGVLNSQSGGNTGIYGSQQYNDYTLLFKTLSGPCGLEVYFEPSCFFQVYRNIFIIGGYYDYSRCNLDVESGFTNTINDLEFMTREIIRPESKVAVKQKINDLFWSISQDTGLKVFVLQCDAGEWEGHVSKVQNGEESDFPTKLSSAKIMGAYLFE